MKTLTLEDVRSALAQLPVEKATCLSNDELLKADFLATLRMNEAQVAHLTSILERQHRILLPIGVSASLKVKNTVAVFIGAANSHLIDLDE